MGKIRVLIVDDSSFVRKALLRIFESDPSMEVAGMAASGGEALERIAELRPDVVTLDVIMPGMDGLDTLKIIMEDHPTPVLMLSQLTKQGAELTLRALEMGAMDFVDKSSTGMMDFLDLEREIILKVKSLAVSKPVKIVARPGELSAGKTNGIVDAVAIGASTGGPLALQMLLSKFPRDIGFTILVVQHMPHGFTGPLAKRLDAICDISVKEAEEGDLVGRPGTALIAPAGLHMKVKGTRETTRIKLDFEPLDATHRPSVDVLFTSVAKSFGDRSIGVILTGMGADGANGMKAIKEAGGFTLAQDEATSAIFGMPRVAIERGFADKVAPITSLADVIMKHA
jgi:two-component system chemotaxis response regulator CheB